MCDSNISASTHLRMKKIQYNGPRSIITQNSNCSSGLVCLANVLLLRSNTSTWFPPNTSTTTVSELLSRLTDLVLSATPDNASSPYFVRKINSAWAFLPRLQFGMEVDVKFNGITEFSSSPGTDLFSILRIPLYHTWLLDPAQESVSSVIGDLSRVELVHKILKDKDSADLVKQMEARQALEFIKSAPNQMTTYGLSQLTLKMDEGQLGVLFRNNDFMTICKHGGGIFQLVTDEGYLQRDDIVWKTLNSIDDAGKFVGHDFQEKGLTVVRGRDQNQDYKYPLRERLPKEGEQLDERRKNCPAGHQLKHVSYETRHREKIVDDRGWRWICDSCENYFGLEGSRFRCDHWQLGTSCDFDLCGKCFNQKQLQALTGAEEKNLTLSRDFSSKQDYKASQQVTSNVKHIETLGVDKGKQGGVSGKNCPGGHRLKEVDINTRLEDNPGWSCGCCLNYLELEGSRFRCDHWKLGTNCDFNLCGECFYRKEIEDDKQSEENGDYWKHVVANIKQLLLDQKHSGGIWERFFGSFYENEFGEKMDFQKLGFPSQNQSNLMKFLNKLSGKMVTMEYIDSRMMIKPSKALLANQAPPLLESLHLGENSLRNTVSGVKKQVAYPPDLKEGDSLDILVTEVVSPAKFWFHLRGIQTSGALDQLMDDMAEFYGDKDNEFEYRLENPCAQCESGAIMAAPYKDLGFHRVLINQICPRSLNKVKVFYVDYGTVGKIPISSVRILHDKFWELPAQALEAKLWGLTNSSGGKKWSRESSNRFHELVTPISDSGWGCLAIVKKIQTHMGMVELELYDTMTSNSPGGICINQKLVEEGHALEEQIPSVEENQKSVAPPAPMPVIKEVSDEVGEEGSGEINDDKDLNNNQFSDTKNTEKEQSTKNGITANETKFLVCKVNLIENTESLLLIHEQKIWIASGDVSLLMPTWRGKDLLTKMLEVRHISIQSFKVSQDDKDKFEQLIVLGVKPSENLDFQFYPLNNVSALVDIFNKDLENAKKIKTIIETVIAKVNQDFAPLFLDSSVGKSDTKVK